MRKLAIVLACVYLAAAPACAARVRLGSFENDKAAAEKALASLHERLSDRDFEAIYNSTDEALRATGSKAQILASMQETRDRNGRFLDGRLRDASCFPEEVRFVFLANYENGPATELISWRVRDGEAKLLAYEISPGFNEPPSSDSVSNCG